MSSEKQMLRATQARDVMPMIGPLLDAWEGLPNDLALDEELEGVRRAILDISNAMENAEPHPTEAAPAAVQESEHLTVAVDYAITHGWPSDSLSKIAAIRAADKERASKGAAVQGLDASLLWDEFIERVAKDAAIDSRNLVNLLGSEAKFRRLFLDAARNHAVQGEALTDERINELRQKHGVTSSGRGIKEWENVCAFARDIISASAPTADPVRIAGRAMANICFNLSQHEGQVLTAQWCASMKEAQKRWDEALSTTKD